MRPSRGLADVGVTTFEVTAIDRDGTLEGPDVDLLARVVGLGRGAIIASAGIASLADVRDVRDLGCAGAIVGRALYDGRLALADALALGELTRPPVATGRGRRPVAIRPAGRQWAASCSFLWASMTFSARWDGTSS